MKKSTYIQDMKDTFKDDTTLKNVLEITKKIKSSQKKAFPSIEFKQHLWDRLANIHDISVFEDEKPRFSLLQILWAFASFIFISGSIISIYQIKNMKDITTQDTYDTQVSPSMISPMQEIWPDSTRMKDEIIIPKMMRMPENTSWDNIQVQEDQVFQSDFEQEIQWNISPEEHSQMRIYWVWELQDDISNDITVSDIPEFWDMNEKEMCQFFDGDYNEEASICVFPNGVECGEFTIENLKECSQRDKYILQ